MTQPDVPLAFVRLAGGAAAIPPGSAKAFPVGRYEVAVFNLDGEYFGLENACPHQGGPLADGWIDGAEVTCPWHGWCFRIRTGQMTLGQFACVPRFDVRREGDDLLVAAEPQHD